MSNFIGIDDQDILRSFQSLTDCGAATLTEWYDFQFDIVWSIFRSKEKKLITVIPTHLRTYSMKKFTKLLLQDLADMWKSMPDGTGMYLAQEEMTERDYERALERGARLGA